MKYIVIEKNVEDEINYYGPFYTELSAKKFIARIQQSNNVYDISPIYSSTSLTHKTKY